MKNIFLIVALICSGLYKAQDVVSLETMAACMNNPETCPDPTYIKDSNGLLNKYVGTWKGSFSGRNYEFNFIKKDNVGEFGTKWDRLIGRLKITDQNGAVIFSNFNKSDDEASWGANFQKDLKAYLVAFSSGVTGCIDSGYLYLRIKPETPNNMIISFYPDMDIVTQDCSNFHTTIPSNKAIHLMKQ